MITNRHESTPYGQPSFGSASRTRHGFTQWDEQGGSNAQYAASHAEQRPARASSAMTAQHPELAGAPDNSGNPPDLNPQENNLYAYVLGNPLKYHDPDGLSPESDMQELQPDTPENELWYGTLSLFLETDVAFAKYQPIALAPLTSKHVSTPVKIAYGIAVAPFAVLGAGLAGWGHHIGESTYHIGKGSVRLGWQAIKYGTKPIDDLVHGAPVESAPNFNLDRPEETGIRAFGGTSQVESPPAGPPPRSIQRRPNFQVARPNVHGCQYGPDSPDPRSQRHSADLRR